MIKQFPNIAPSDISWKLVTKNFYNPSLFGGTGQTLETPGSFWWARLTYENLEPDEMRPLIAFLLSLRGPAERFKIWNFGVDTLGEAKDASVDSNGYLDPQFTTITLNEPSGEELPSITVHDTGLGFLQIGDYVEISSFDTDKDNEIHELKMVVSEELNTQDNRVTYEITPFIRNQGLSEGGSINSPYTNLKYKVLRPQAKFRLLDDDQLEWDISEKIKIGSITIEIIEAPG